MVGQSETDAAPNWNSFQAAIALNKKSNGLGYSQTLEQAVMPQYQNFLHDIGGATGTVLSGLPPELPQCKPVSSASLAFA
jgi:hypothetical protein